MKTIRLVKHVSLLREKWETASAFRKAAHAALMKDILSTLLITKYERACDAEARAYGSLVAVEDILALVRDGAEVRL